MDKLRLFFFFAGIITAILAAGFYFNQSWATWIWPFYTYRMSRIFIVSILLAVAVPVFLIGYYREYAGTRGGALNLAVMFAIMSGYTLSETGAVFVFGVVTALFFVFQVGLFIATRSIPFQDTRPTPKPVLWSFGLFIVVLIMVGGALLAGVDDILPWSVSNDLSFLYGAVFLGAAVFFASAIKAGVWGAARGPLAGFLAYDLVLIGPFVSMFPNVSDKYFTSLIMYTTVVVYSGALAVWYLIKGPRSI